MRTQTLLVAAAALAVGIISSEAQVYSGVVGYVNIVCSNNVLALVSNPLDNGTNDLNSLVGSLPSKSTVQIWNGGGFTTITKTATWNPDPVIPVGTGFFVKSASTLTNTFVGSVDVPIGGTTTNALTQNVLYLVGSTIPYSAGLNDTNLALNTLPSKSTVQIWNGGGFTTITKTATWPAGTTNPVAGGFFVKSSATTNWVQTLNP
jgi:hypothetical protein